MPYPAEDEDAGIHQASKPGQHTVIVQVCILLMALKYAMYAKYGGM